MRTLTLTLLSLLLMLTASPARPLPFDVVYGGDAPSPTLHAYANNGRVPTEVGVGGQAADGVLSPDATRIAFIENVEKGFALCTIGVDGNRRRELIRHPLILGPSWSPDGTRIIYVACTTEKSKPELLTIAADGMGERHIRLIAPSGVKLGEGLHRPHLGRDGSVLLTVRVGRRPHLMLIGPAGGPARLLCDGMDGVWSPDGSRLAYIEWKQDKMLLRLARADASDAVTVPVEHGFSPIFSPDGQRLYFNVAADNGIEVWVADVDGKTPPHRVDAIPVGAVLSISARILLMDLLDPH